MQYMSLTTNVPVTNTKFEALKNSKEKDNHPKNLFPRTVLSLFKMSKM